MYLKCVAFTSMINGVQFNLCMIDPLSTEASMDPPNVAMFTWASCFMSTCRGITSHDDMEYVNMTT